MFISEATESYDTLDSAKFSSKLNNDDMFVVSTSPMTSMWYIVVPLYLSPVNLSRAI
jgi:hypothetical protein